MTSIGILGMGVDLPSQVVTNEMVQAETGFDPADHRGRSLDDWARHHHGGVTRHRAAGGEATSDLASRAAGAALRSAGVDVQDVDLLVVATVTSDFRLPPSAAVVQEKLGLGGKFIQLDSACTGFMDAAECAAALLRAGGYRHALVAAADVTDPFLAPDDWLGRTVFGDGAGAALLGKVPDGYGFGPFVSGSDGSLGGLVRITAGGTRMPFRVGSDPGGEQYLQAQFGEVNSWGVPKLVEAAKEALSLAAIGTDDVDWVVAHQASSRMVLGAADQLGIPHERVVLTYPELGNTVGSSLPIALHEALQRGAMRQGDMLLLCAVGAGMAWSAATYRWW
jgi:3-oxoacyl-[acyl-carrier-protein] synthase III